VSQCQGDLRLSGQGGVAAGESQRQHVVGGRDRVAPGTLLATRARGDACPLLAVQERETLLAPDVYRLAPRGRGEPRTRPVRQPVDGPSAGSGQVCLLHGVLRELQVAQPAGQGRDHLRPVLGPDLANLVHGGQGTTSEPGVTGRTSTDPVRTFGTLAAQASASSSVGTSIR